MVRLPAEYQEVECLESTGTQWINTGISLSRIIDINVNWTLRFALTNLKTQILGGTNSYNKQIVVIQKHLRRDWVSTQNYGQFSPELSTDAIYEISQKDGYYEFTDKNGNVESKEITLYSSNNYPFILFAKSMNTEGTAVENNTRACMKLYSFVMSGETEIANFIPCYRKSDNEPGMYDTVSKSFYTNSGTGTFLVGNDVSWDAASLLERRRQIMSISNYRMNTIPKIAEYGKHCNRSATGIGTDADWCYTEWYSLEYDGYQAICDNMTTSNRTFQYNTNNGT